MIARGRRKVILLLCLFVLANVNLVESKSFLRSGESESWNPFLYLWKLLFSRSKHGDEDNDALRNRPEDAVMYGQPVYFEPQQMKDAGKIANIVGGSDASSNEAPWFVMLLEWNAEDGEWKYFGCGGTVVSDRHVLTAAHCVEGRELEKDGVYVHAYQPFMGNPGVDYHFSLVDTYTLHPDFDDGPNWSDVAIITMKSALNLNDFPDAVVPAHPDMEVQDGDMYDVYGFGRMKETDSSLVNTLQTASLPYISGSSCAPYYNSGKIYEDMFCAGYDEGKMDSCNGDSGGPLVKTMGGQAVQFGIVSWGEGCGRSQKPGVYANVQYHYDFIQETVCGDPDVQTMTDLCSEADPTPGPSPSPTSPPSTTTPTSSPTEDETGANLEVDNGNANDTWNENSSFEREDRDRGGDRKRDKRKKGDD